MSYEVTITDVLKAAKVLQGKARHTPLEYSPYLSEITGGEIWLKLENQQLTGSFKLRGALNKMLTLPPEQRANGVITCSSGNHAQAMALAAKMLKVKTVIYVPGQCPQFKQEAIRIRGGEYVDLRVFGTYYDDAEPECMRAAKAENMTFVSAFDDPAVSAGQGTLGLEMLLDEPELNTLICPISGAGLIHGVTAAAKALNPKLKAWGVCAALNPAWPEALKQGKVVPVNEEVSLADGLGGGACQNHFEFIRDNLEGVLTVTEKEIADGIRFMFEKHHQIVEGAGAVAVAAVLAGKADVRGKKAGIVISGGNIDEEKLLAAIKG